mmetsp:Transcript_104623/g.156716  ORF Transcript_104623/g.156716 Transcript_104623/m.156716 type:complete len:234 (-) Transcript_104623:1742-2443(-)
MSFAICGTVHWVIIVFIVGFVTSVFIAESHFRRRRWLFIVPAWGCDRKLAETSFHITVVTLGSISVYHSGIRRNRLNLEWRFRRVRLSHNLVERAFVVAVVVFGTVAIHHFGIAASCSLPFELVETTLVVAVIALFSIISVYHLGIRFSSGLLFEPFELSLVVTIPVFFSPAVDHFCGIAGFLVVFVVGTLRIRSVRSHRHSSIFAFIITVIGSFLADPVHHPVVLSVVVVVI